ncbi:hypothetical protein EFV80_05510 [Yersinia enterocolitica]|nr:hypothetical protein [Yersinia enterocolitica]EKN5930890.1 hypothetical protein [Yersinia enterocolitica]
MMYSSHLLAVALMTLDIIINYNNTALVSAALLNISYKFADYLPMFISVILQAAGALAAFVHPSHLLM